MKKKVFKEDLVYEVQQDFLKRQRERKPFEAKWKLNNNFFIGNQYSGINRLSDIENYDKQYYWQEREVFNHIAPILEARLSKLSMVRPKITVVPVSGTEEDVKVAKLSRDILSSVYQKLNLNKVISEVTNWSEITGTGFYKIMWNGVKGKTICVDDMKNNIKEGEVEVEAISPYEIFPDSQEANDVENCGSIIHAKAVSIKEIKNVWGVDVEAEATNVLNFGLVGNSGGLGYRSFSQGVGGEVKKDYAIVIERYESPSVEFPDGRLVIVCGNKLLYVGALPYIDEMGKRGFPFVRQISVETPGCFWGTSVIERLIPIQRAYNAVKNRKHEYLNRLSMGVLMVEDGSVDIENLEEEGLSPGKVLVYRQGANPPKIMEKDSMPNEFSEEEEKLLNEFSEIGGVSNILTSSAWSRSLSGTALELLVEQDSARLNLTTENIKCAMKLIATKILRLYKQFAVTPRLIKVTNSNNDVEVVYWKNSNLSASEIEIETESANGENISSRREEILKLLSLGLLSDENGKISASVKLKILELFGLGVWDGNIDENLLQKNHADSENLKLLSGDGDVEVLEIDNNDIHLNRHISFMLDKEYAKAFEKDKTVKDRFLKHILEHRKISLK